MGWDSDDIINIYAYIYNYIIYILGNSLENGDAMVYQQTIAEEGFEQHLQGHIQLVKSSIDIHRLYFPASGLYIGRMMIEWKYAMSFTGY